MQICRYQTLCLTVLLSHLCTVHFVMYIVLFFFSLAHSLTLSSLYTATYISVNTVVPTKISRKSIKAKLNLSCVILPYLVFLNATLSCTTNNMTHHNIPVSETTKRSVKVEGGGIKKNKKEKTQNDDQGSRGQRGAASVCFNTHRISAKRTSKVQWSRPITSHQPPERKAAGGRRPCRWCVGCVSKMSGWVQCCWVQLHSRIVTALRCKHSPHKLFLCTLTLFLLYPFLMCTIVPLFFVQTSHLHSNQAIDYSDIVNFNLDSTKLMISIIPHYSHFTICKMVFVQQRTQWLTTWQGRAFQMLPNCCSMEKKMDIIDTAFGTTALGSLWSWICSFTFTRVYFYTSTCAEFVLCLLQ